MIFKKGDKVNITGTKITGKVDYDIKDMKVITSKNNKRYLVPSKGLKKL